MKAGNNNIIDIYGGTSRIVKVYGGTSLIWEKILGIAPSNTSFESGISPWINVSGDNFDWTWDSGGTPSSSTGPSSGADGSYYLFTESSSNYGNTAILQSPSYVITNETKFFNFWYHMYGSAMGTLSVKVNGLEVWTLSGDQGNQWYQTTIDLSAYVGTSVVIEMVGLTGTSFTSDIAIDAFTFTENAPVVLDPPVNESFELGLGAWTQLSTDNFDWTRQTGTTPSSSTGPSGAQHGSYYMFTESSSNYGNTAILESPEWGVTSSTKYMNFWYHMYGSSMGTLSIKVNGTTVWSKTGDQTNKWHQASIDMSSYIGTPIKIQIVGLTGSSFTSDMCVDNITFTSSLPVNETISASSTYLYYLSGGGTQTISITASGSWTATSFGGSTAISPSTGTSGTTSVDLTRFSNGSTSAISDTVRFALDSNSAVYVDVYIDQEGDSGGGGLEPAP